MQGYNYNLTGAQVTAARSSGLGPLLKPVDPASPDGDQVAGPLTPGAFVNKLLMAGSLPAKVSVDQSAHTVSFNDDTHDVSTFTVATVPQFGDL